MANTQAMCASFKAELMNGYHNFTATNPARTVNTADTFKIALFLDAAGLSSATTAYSSTNECTASGSYTAGGSAVTFLAPTVSGITAYCSPTGASTVQWTTFTATNFSAALIYNVTNGNRAVSVHAFSPQSITSGTFTITYPAYGAGTALLNIA